MAYFLNLQTFNISKQCLKKPRIYNYRTRAIITRSWLQTADFFEEFPCLVHKLSVILAALQYKPQLKMG